MLEIDIEQHKEFAPFLDIVDRNRIESIVIRHNILHALLERLVRPYGLIGLIRWQKVVKILLLWKSAGQSVSVILAFQVSYGVVWVEK